MRTYFNHKQLIVRVGLLVFLYRGCLLWYLLPVSAYVVALATGEAPVRSTADRELKSPYGSRSRFGRPRNPPPNVNGKYVFPLFAVCFACHHPLETTGGPSCAGVSRSGRWLSRARS